MSDQINSHTITNCYDDGEYRIQIWAYQNGAGPGLYLDWIDDEDEWSEQVPLPITPASARAIAAKLIEWAAVIEFASALKQAEV